MSRIKASSGSSSGGSSATSIANVLVAGQAFNANHIVRGSMGHRSQRRNSG